MFRHNGIAEMPPQWEGRLSRKVNTSCLHITAGETTTVLPDIVDADCGSRVRIVQQPLCENVKALCENVKPLCENVKACEER